MPRGGWQGTASHRVLEDAFRTGVVDKLTAGHESFLHGHLAPGAQAIGKIGGEGFGTGSHSQSIFHDRREPCQPTSSWPSQKTISITVMQKKKTVL
jgi:hypothetical protein